MLLLRDFAQGLVRTTKDETGRSDIKALLEASLENFKFRHAGKDRPAIKGHINKIRTIYMDIADRCQIAAMLQTWVHAFEEACKSTVRKRYNGDDKAKYPGFRSTRKNSDVVTVATRNLAQVAKFLDVNSSIRLQGQEFADQ